MELLGGDGRWRPLAALLLVAVLVLAGCADGGAFAEHRDDYVIARDEGIFCDGPGPQPKPTLNMLANRREAAIVGTVLGIEKRWNSPDGKRWTASDRAAGVPTSPVVYADVHLAVEQVVYDDGQEPRADLTPTVHVLFRASDICVEEYPAPPAAGTRVVIVLFKGTSISSDGTTSRVFAGVMDSGVWVADMAGMASEAVDGTPAGNVAELAAAIAGERAQGLQPEPAPTPPAAEAPPATPAIVVDDSSTITGPGTTVRSRPEPPRVAEPT